MSVFCLSDTFGTRAHKGDKDRGRWVSVKQYKAFLVDCLFDHNCEKVSVAVCVGKCVEGLKKMGLYVCTCAFEGRGDKHQWKT